MNDLTLDNSLTRWSTRERDAKPLIVLLHGYGADENDLFGLVPHLPEGVAIASVAAPLAMPRPARGRSWYSLDDRDRADPEQITVAARAVLDWLEQHAASASDITLFGFSQGAAVSLQVMRLAPERLRAVVALSGYVDGGELPADAGLPGFAIPVFWGRGTHDDVISNRLIEHTAMWLPAHSTLTAKVYPGLTHSISEAELEDVRQFLSR